MRAATRSASATTIPRRRSRCGCSRSTQRCSLSQIIRHRIERAIALRQRVIRGDTDCYRLVNGDGDGLSGVVVDRYGERAGGATADGGGGSDARRNRRSAARAGNPARGRRSRLSSAVMARCASRRASRIIARCSRARRRARPSRSNTASGSRSISIAGRRPARSSISARIGRCCASWRAAHGCSTRTVTAAASAGGDCGRGARCGRGRFVGARIGDGPAQPRSQWLSRVARRADP